MRQTVEDRIRIRHEVEECYRQRARQLRQREADVAELVANAEQRAAGRGPATSNARANRAAIGGG